MTYLIDTNVLSEVRKPHRAAPFAEWWSEVRTDDLYLSVLVIGEIVAGIERLRRRRDYAQADVFERWVGSVVSDFCDRILDVSLPAARRWGTLRALATVPVVDGLIAATALEHDLTLVTRDTGALAGTGVRLLDPWATGRTG